MYRHTSQPKRIVDFISNGRFDMSQREEFDIFSTEQIQLCTHFFSIIQKTKSNAHEESVDDYSLFLKDIVVIMERLRYFEYGLTPLFTDSLYSYLSFYGKSGNTFIYARMCADLIREYITKNSDEDNIVEKCTSFVQLVIDLYHTENSMIPIAEMVAHKKYPEYEERANPYHDELGRFCRPEDAVFISPWANNRVDNPQEPPPSTLTDEQKKHYKEALRCSDDVIAYIRNKQEAEIYVKAGLHEETVCGRKCLIRDDIDYDFQDSKGSTNRERMKDGNAPYGLDGKLIELHHIGQRDNSPLAELSKSEHTGKDSDKYLHDKIGESMVDHSKFSAQKKNHWIERSEEE